jgi:CheY-like chemotaxis protein
MPTKNLILCVDDECNGLEGRRMLLEDRPVDLVLIDYHMPGMNGDVVAEHMKAIRSDVPIAILSANERLPESALRSVEAFISKSESPGNLLQIVEHLLNVRLHLWMIRYLRDNNATLRKATDRNLFILPDRSEAEGKHLWDLYESSTPL